MKTFPGGGGGRTYSAFHSGNIYRIQWHIKGVKERFSTNK